MNLNKKGKPLSRVNVKKILVGVLTVGAISAHAQVTNTDTTTNEPLNSVANIIAGNSSKRITLGTYAQIDYNQQFGDTVGRTGKLDIHRMVLFLGYRFGKKTTFVSELEIEHVKEVAVEQAFINHNFSEFINLRAGLVLIPMGIQNEYHEPPTFHGVERTNVESKIIPTTWREMGAGFAGKFPSLSLRYQLYAVNGFNGYDGSGTFRGSDGLRKGRQKAAESFMSSPNFAGKIDYYGIKGLKLGLAGYYGDSQTTAYNSVKPSDAVGMSAADSTVIGISMVAADARYVWKGLDARALWVFSELSNTAAYNTYTGKDVGSSMMGYYIEAGYDVLSLFPNESRYQVKVFGRYEFYDTHWSTFDAAMKQDAYSRTDITAGIGWWLAPGAVLKADYQLFSNAANQDAQQLNFGVGIWF